MNDEERKEELLRFAKAFGDAAGVLVLAFVGVATAVRECTDAMERFAATQEKEAPGDADSA